MYIQKNDAESLLGLIDGALRKEDVNWNNCVAIGMDNTSVSSIVIEVTELFLFLKKDFYTKIKHTSISIRLKSIINHTV